MSYQTLEEQKQEIYLLIDYGAPEKLIGAAKKMVEGFQTDRVALNIFKEFYSFLPEAENDCITRLQLLEARQGRFLLLLTTELDKYIYLATLEHALFLGRHEDGIWDEGVLEFFGMDNKESVKKFQVVEEFQDYMPLGSNESRCLLCSVEIGEAHRLGCPAEVCPWCSGQLSSCNCKFNQVVSDKISTEKQLKAFHEKLQKKGRIPFDPSQQPGGWQDN